MAEEDRKLYWLDLETTGLLPGVPYAQILEIAVAVSDFNNPFELKHIHHQVLAPTDPERTWAHMDPFVRTMHTESGLWEECLASKTHGVTGWLASPIHDHATLAGSSVHFDHEWLRYYHFDIGRRFAHRHYDVSAVKLFCQSLGMKKIPKGEAHRAKDDIEESAQHGKLCAEWLARYGFQQHNKQILGALRE